MMQKRFGKLQRLTVKGFKSIRALVELDLDDINILIGQNGAGKSNFVSLFRFIPKLSGRDLPDYVTKQGGIEKILHFGPKMTDKLEIRFSSDLYEYDAVLEPTIEGGLIFTKDRFLSKHGDKAKIGSHWELDEVEVAKISNTNQFRRHVYRMIEKWRVYHFHDTSESAGLRGNSTLTEPEQLAANGGNLAAFLYFLQEKHPAAFDTVLDTVQQVAPFLGTLILQPEALNPDLIRLRWRHIGHDELFDVSDLSDGTLRFIALTALLLQPDPPSTIVLDEPELGLHPAAISQLAALMQQVSPEVQIIAATQSPTFANHFGWQDFIVVDRHEEASRFRRLQEEEVKAWMDDYAMGEIWEKNLIGGRP